MFEYNGMMHQGGPDYSRVILKGFLNNFEHTEDGLFYLTKGLEMLLHELENELSNDKTISYEDASKQFHRISRLRRCIEELKGTA